MGARVMNLPREINDQPLTTQASLFQAAQALEQATNKSIASADFLHEVHEALRGCVLAVEYHLDTVSGKTGAGAVRIDVPRLLPELERLEADLALCLVAVWTAKSEEAQPTERLRAAITGLVRTVREAASDEFDLVHEVGRPIGDVG